MVGRGEIDIVGRLQGRPVVFEVKTVTGAAGRLGSDAVDDKKQAQLRRLGAALDPPATRIDVVEVSLDANGAEVRWLRWL